MIEQGAPRHRMLIADDNEAIHNDLRKILSAPPDRETALNAAEAALFGGEAPASAGFEIDSAYQGRHGLERLEEALAAGRPYSLAFVDVRMPPGWDGIETITRLWAADPRLQVIICTAYTDYSWRDIVGRLGVSHNFVILKKPFDNIEVLQLAHALAAKREAVEGLEREIHRRQGAEAELVAALDRAEEANRCKHAFLSMIGHELRTPLNAILGYSEMLEEDARRLEQPEMVSALVKVQTAGRHLLSLIADILDMARIESGRMPIHAQQATVGELARGAVEMVSPMAEANANRLDLRLGRGEEGMVMEVDVTRFRQSLLNLLSNACKFTSNGTVALEVGREEAAGRTWLNWCVRDTGIGIAEDQLGRLFQPFTQVDSAATRKYGGSGLGLAISRRLCEMMGGALTVESRLGEGSTFTMRMPATAPSP